jgi:hypothetical protein
LVRSVALGFWRRLGINGSSARVIRLASAAELIKRSRFPAGLRYKLQSHLGDGNESEQQLDLTNDWLINELAVDAVCQDELFYDKFASSIYRRI